MEIPRIQHLFIAMVAGLFIPNPTAAGTVSISSMKDNTLYESDTGALSNGGGRNFFVGGTNFGLKRRGLIAFDIAANVPAGSTIHGVTLILHLSKTTAGPGTISLYRVLADWGEGNSIATPEREGLGAQAAQGDSTWLHTFHDTGFWSAPGGDFSSTPSASAPVSGVDFYGWTLSPQMVSDVQSWLDSPQANFGWALVADDESLTQTARRFDTRENQNQYFRPVLQVQFTPPADGGVTDAGLEDGGSSDAGADAGLQDGGSGDAGVDAGLLDGGSSDAGVIDAGPTDAGPTDAGADGGLPDSGIPDGGQPLSEAPQSTSGCEIGSSGPTLVMGILAVLLLGIVQARWRASKRREIAQPDAEGAPPDR